MLFLEVLGCVGFGIFILLKKLVDLMDLVVGCLE